jgi:hypothetical protein
MPFINFFRLAVEIAAGLAILWKFMQPLRDAVKEQAKRTELMEEGIQSILHDRIYQACTFYIKRGWVTVSDLKNLEHMFEPYEDMGGNGTAKELYERVKDLPIREE